jgi:phage gp46-like protein
VLALRYEPAVAQADVAEGGDDADLETEILVALLTDARADARELPPGVDNRGWWDDAIAGEPIGSLLWLCELGPASDQNARRAEQFARDALAYLVRDKRARAVEATATIDDGAIYLSIGIDGVERVSALRVTA